MQALTLGHKKLFIQDFRGGVDGIIRQVSFPLHDLFPHLELILSVQCRDAWGNLRLRFYDVETLTIRGDPQVFQVLSQGLAFDWFVVNRKERLLFSLGLNPNRELTREDYLGSEFLVIANRCYWEKLPYAESPDESGLFVDTEAVVIDQDASKEGLDKTADSDELFFRWLYEYEYLVPGSDRMMKHRDKIEFYASVFGHWFSKYPNGFRFPIRYNKNVPTQHVRLHEFD